MKNSVLIFSIFLVISLTGAFGTYKLVKSLTNLSKTLEAAKKINEDLDQCIEDRTNDLKNIAKYEQWLLGCMRMQITCEDNLQRVYKELEVRK